MSTARELKKLQGKLTVLFEEPKEQGRAPTLGALKNFGGADPFQLLIAFGVCSVFFDASQVSFMAKVWNRLCPVAKTTIRTA